MWFNILLLVSSVYGLENADKEHTCKERYNSCYVQYPLSRFPADAEDLATICKVGIEIFTCRTAIAESCKGTEVLRGQLDYVKDTLQGFKYICNTSSSLNRGILENLSCLGTVFQPLKSKNECHDFAQKLRETADLENIQEEDREKYECLFTAVEISCFLAKIGETCGENTESVALDTLIKVNIANKDCHKVNAKKTKELINVFKLEQQIIDRIKLYLDSM